VFQGVQVSPWEVIALVTAKFNRSANLKYALKIAMLEYGKATRAHPDSLLGNGWTLPTALVRTNTTRWSSKASNLECNVRLLYV
jgi:hypothetical protein